MKKLKIKAYAHPETVKILKKGYKVNNLSKLLSGPVDKAILLPILETDKIETKNYTLQPIYTPGHCDDHYCYYEANKGWLFSGDLFVAERIKYFSYFESMLTQIESLKKLLKLDFDVLFCSHNPKTKNGKEHLSNKLHFFEDFAGKVTQYYGQGKSVKEIFSLMRMKENVYYKVITSGEFTAENMVKSVVNDLNSQQSK